MPITEKAEKCGKNILEFTLRNIENYGTKSSSNFQIKSLRKNINYLQLLKQQEDNNLYNTKENN